jgi:hypothetical protein
MAQSPGQRDFPAERVRWSERCLSRTDFPGIVLWPPVAGSRFPGEGGLDQRFRLEMEGVKFSGRKVRMAEFEYKFSRNRTTEQKKSIGRSKKAAANRREKRES